MSAGIYHLDGHIGSTAIFRKLRQRHPGRTVTPLEFIRRLAGESDADFLKRLCVAEQRHLGKNGVAVGPDPLDFAPAEPVDLARVRACRGPLTTESRRRMSEAKRGGRNHRSRSVTVTDPDGIEMEFDSVTGVAAFFGVTQQLMDSWMSGKVGWPRQGKGRKVNRWIAAYRARYVERAAAAE